MDLNCTVSGLPAPLLTWTKDGMPMNRKNLTADDSIVFSEDNQVVHLANAQEKHSGEWACRAENHVGSLELYKKVVVIDKSRLAAPAIAAEAPRASAHMPCTDPCCAGSAATARFWTRSRRCTRTRPPTPARTRPHLTATDRPWQRQGA